MKIKIGSKLYNIRSERKLSQNEMADLLSISASTYSRLERNETTIPFEELNRFSEVLNIPIQDFLPEILSIQNSHNGHGVVFGNVIYNYFYDKDTTIKELENKIQTLTNKLNQIQNKTDNY